MSLTDTHKLRYQQLAIALLILVALAIFTAIYFTFRTTSPQPISARVPSSRPIPRYASTEIFAGAEHGDNEKIAMILRADPNAVKLQDDKKRTALHVAAGNGQVETVKLLLSKKSDVNARDHEGTISLLNAAFGGHKQTAETLLNAGSDINSKDDHGATALYYAAAKGHGGLAEFLISKGADIDAKANNGVTPLAVAIKQGHTELASRLKQHGAAE